MRQEKEIRERLRRYHGHRIEKEMGGHSSYDKAEELLWALGYDTREVDILPDNDKLIPQGIIDLSEYVEVQ